MPSTSRREKSLGALGGLGGAKATFTAQQVADPANPGVTVQGLRIILEDEGRKTSVYLDDESYGPDHRTDYFEVLARTLEIDWRQHRNAPDLVTSADLALNNRVSGRPVLNVGWGRTEDGNFTLHLYTRGCGTFSFPATAYPRVVNIFIAASEFFNKTSPR
jgi:hypothetical protein